MTTVYGIPNCDSVKKARKWLDARGVAYAFHDFRADGLEAGKAQGWIDALGWETLVNKRSTSWKTLDPAVRNAMDDAHALEAVLETPTLIKRPVLEQGGVTHVGFSADGYEEIFG